MKVYLASSWKNADRIGRVATTLREHYHEVYDFTHPPDVGAAFNWDQIDPNWQRWTTAQFRKALKHSLAKRGFGSDFGGMQWADACVLILPCGRSAHMEAGWFAGAKKPVFILIEDGLERAELTYKLAQAICTTVEGLATVVDKAEVT